MEPVQENGTKDQDEHVSKEVGDTANGEDKEIKENTGKEKNKGEEEEGEAREDQQEITQRQTYVLEEKKTTVHKSVVEDTQQEHQHPKEVEHAPEEESTGEGPTTTVTDGDTTTDQEKTTYNSITSRSLEVGGPASTDAGTSKLDTSPQSSQTKEHNKQKGRKKRKKSKAPKLRRRSSKADTQRAEQYLTAILLSYFQTLDHESSGLLPADVFWEIVASQELNLQLTDSDISMLQTMIPPDDAGMISYAEFVVSARTLLTTIYENRSDTESQSVEVRGIDGTSVMLNKKTGAVKDLAEGGGFDLFEDTIRDLFTTTDTENKGHVTTDDFIKMLSMQEMTNYLQSGDIEYMTQQFPDGTVSFAEFYPIAKELILRVYRSKDPSENEWLPLSSPRVGLFWFNKFTGETRREVSPQGEREQELMLISQLNAEVEAGHAQLEQERIEAREMQNQLALANEELERMAMQLDETGQQLDNVHNELTMKERESSQFSAIIEQKEQTIAELQAHVAAVKQLEVELRAREDVLKETQKTVVMKEQSLTERDAAIATLQHELTSIVDQLKSAQGIIDARESTIAQLQKELGAEQERLKELEDHAPILEEKLARGDDELKRTRYSLEDKSAILSQTRRQLKLARDKNKELEANLAKLGSVNDKLKNAECEIRTLKQFVMSKTAMVERRKAEIAELKAKLAEVESKDNRRAVILADVLEKTARTYQQQLTSTAAAAAVTPSQYNPSIPLTSKVTGNIDRPCSAPHLPMDVVQRPIAIIENTETPRKFSLQPSMPVSMWPHHTSPKKTQIKARTVPKLPPLRRRPPFCIPTELEIVKTQRKRDLDLLPHAASNPDCQCQLCLLSHPSGAVTGHLGSNRMKSLMEGMVGGEDGVAATRYQQQLHTNETELKISQEIKIGQRVLLQTKKSVYDLEPQKLTGVVKYIGKVDSEFVDNRIYVGVRLDEPVGNTDGLFKGKRYFTCTQNHGKMVRITNIIAVLPPKSVVYRPIELNSSPYTSTQTHRKGTLRV